MAADQEEVEAAWFTVCGLYFDNFQRYVNSYEAASPQMAEEMAQMDVRSEGATRLLVATVIPGQHRSCDVYARWTDPSSHTEEQMEQVLGEWGLR